jgi:hypothetical protein
VQAKEVGEITMRKLIWVGLLCGIVGFVLGNAFWYLASPLWIDREVSETFVETNKTKVLATGQFSGADALHRGTGQVQAIDTGSGLIVRFSDFEVTNGPDLYVWLVKASKPKESSDVKDSEWLELGVLKGNVGDQNYSVPEGTDLAQYRSVVVWCKQFGVLFASAGLDG